MSVQDMLRGDADALDRELEYVTQQIEDTEQKIVELRSKRDDIRVRRAELLAAATFLDNAGFRVTRDPLTVHIDPPGTAA